MKGVERHSAIWTGGSGWLTVKRQGFTGVEGWVSPQDRLVPEPWADIVLKEEAAHHADVGLPL